MLQRVRRVHRRPSEAVRYRGGSPVPNGGRAHRQGARQHRLPRLPLRHTSHAAEPGASLHDAHHATRTATR